MYKKAASKFNLVVDGVLYININKKYHVLFNIYPSILQGSLLDSLFPIKYHEKLTNIINTCKNIISCILFTARA